DVKELTDVSVTIELLQQKDQDISGKKKQLYAERDSEKSRCKTAEDFVRFKDSEEQYYGKLEILKTAKKNTKLDRNILDRIFWKEIIDKEEKIEAELASRIPVGNMDDVDIGRIKDVEVPENPYKITEIQDWTETRIESEKNVSDETIRTETVETAESVEEFEKTVDTVTIDAVTVDSPVAEIVEEAPNRKDAMDKDTNILELPATKREYDKLSIDEKIERFHFGDISVDQARDIVSKYLNSIGYSSYFSEIYDESNRVSEAYGKQRQQKFVTREIQKASAVMSMIDMTKQQFAVTDVSMKAKLFDLESVDYKTGLQVYKGFLEKIGIQKDVMEVYEEFDKVYEASVNEQTQDKEKTRGSR
ncbi:MAG: hypothetical protein RR533_08985, partial [Carnobacterium sp.]